MKPFRFGDLVTCESWGEGIITNCDISAHEGDTGVAYDFEYATHNYAWVTHEELTLVKKCCKETLDRLRLDLEEEED